MDAPVGKVAWVGRGISALVGIVFVLSAAMKLKGGAEATQGLVALGLTDDHRIPLAITELACAAVFFVPQTAVLGAVLLTGFLGGAVLAHARIGDPFIIPVVLGVLVWVGISLREPRLQSLIPTRRQTPTR